MNKLISVVITTYNRPQLLIKCLKSLSLQTCSKNDFEVIVINDGPDYQVKLLVESFNQKGISFKYGNLAEKSGSAAARNLGWKMASSNLIAFTNENCLPDKDWLKNLLAVYNNEEYIAYSGKLIVPIATIPTDYEKKMAELENARFLAANCCCTKKALEKVDGFDERFSVAWREDSDLEFKFILNNIPIIKNNGAIVEHPVQKAPWGISVKEQRKEIYNVLLYKKYPALYRQLIQKEPVWNYYLMLLLFTGIIVGLFTSLYFSIACGFFYCIFLFSLIGKRLTDTSHTFSHTIEIICTSIIIPFYSVYWQISGAFKYRTLLL